MRAHLRLKPVREFNGKQVSPQMEINKEGMEVSNLLQFLLFIDDRPYNREHTQEIQNYLERLKQESSFQLEMIEVGARPDLVEHFRLMATPSLVKIYPEPRQILAGSDLLAELKKWWPQWLRNAQEYQEISKAKPSDSLALSKGEISSLEEIRLSEEIFRLKREKEELLEQVQFKDRVLAMLAHDLRSPLTAAAIAVETLELVHNHPQTENSKALIEQLYKQTRAQFRTMNRMITDILQAAKGKSGELRLQLESLYLPSFCEEILTEFQERFRGKCLNITKDLPQDLPPVYADPELIRQVLTNLLDNAIKYTPENGEVNLSILHRTTQKVQISVGDTGPGIPEEKKERVFEGHFRLKRDREKEGYGIGLSLCRQIVRAHYGQIWVDSIPNQGSCFHFTLPIHR